MVDQLVIEDTSTTASFVVTVGLLFWLKQEARRRGVSVSECLRDILETARREAA